MSLKLILEVTSELSSRNTEQVFNQVTCEADTLVGVVVLVVGVTAFNGHFENLADDAAEIDSFLFTVFNLVAKVGQQFTVKQLVDTCFTVFLLLASGEFLLQPLVAFFSSDHFVFFVVVDFVDVGNDELEGICVSSDSLENLLVVFNAECTHEHDNGNCGGTSSADLDHEHSVTALFNSKWLSHTVFLRENLSDFGLLSVALVDLNSDTVRSQVFHRDENTLGTVDNEIASGVKGVLAFLA